MIRIYAGTQDFIDFFLYLVQRLDLNISYKIIDVDGELEIEIGGVADGINSETA